MYAVIQDRGKQYIVRPGQSVRLDRMDVAPGTEVVFDRVLLTGGDEDGSGDVRVGTPVLEGASVKGTVLGEHRDKKIIVFKKKRRKGYRRKQGHRQSYTQVQVNEIA